jgi:phosphoribosylpyrophosphate synthetase
MLQPGKDVIIVDDLVQTGGTLYECAVALREKGAATVSAFVVHSVFPNSAWTHFCRSSGDRSRAVFDKIITTNSIPTVSSALPTDDVFEVLDLLPQILHDLDSVS